MYVYMKCVLKNDFMQSTSPDPVHRWVEIGGRDMNSRKELTLKNVLYVLEICKNLVSGSFLNSH